MYGPEALLSRSCVWDVEGVTDFLAKHVRLTTAMIRSRPPVRRETDLSPPKIPISGFQLPSPTCCFCMRPRLLMMKTISALKQSFSTRRNWTTSSRQSCKMISPNPTLEQYCSKAKPLRFIVNEKLSPPGSEIPTATQSN
jgi:hypothetical protein